MPETNNETPKNLEALVDLVLHYHPKPITAAQKKRRKKQKKVNAG